MCRFRPSVRAQTRHPHARQPPRCLRSRTQNKAILDLRRPPAETGKGRGPRYYLTTNGSIDAAGAVAPRPTLWHFNGAGIGFLQRSCKAVGRYVAKALPSAELGKQRGNNLGADTTRRRIRKMLSKGLRSHSGWRGLSLRSEEHTSELQSRLHLVCRLLLEKKKRATQQHTVARSTCL